MKCLNDNISFYITINQAYTAGIYTYYLYEYESQPTDKKLIFVGNIYLDGIKANNYIDCTDIIRSRKQVLTDWDKMDSYSINANLIKKYTLSITINGTEYTADNTVGMIYEYPNQRYDTKNDNIYYAYDSSTYYRVPLQGYNNTNGTYSLIPHYPLKETDIYQFSQTFIVGSTVGEFEISFEGGFYGDYKNAEGVGGYSTYFSMALSEAIIWDLAPSFNGEDLHVYFDSDDTKVFGILDNCYKRYYLMWQDRLGGIQSQAFLDNITYGEDITNDEVQNFTNTRKKSSVQVLPKWKLNSGWIKEDVFPFYESILVSPFVKLYDTRYDCCYDVIVNGNFTEKTYKNEKKLLNLTLDLESTNKQTIIY